MKTIEFIALVLILVAGVGTTLACCYWCPDYYFSGCTPADIIGKKKQPSALPLEVGGRRPSTGHSACERRGDGASLTVRAGHGPRRSDGRNTRVSSTQRPNSASNRPAGRRTGPVLHGGRAGRAVGAARGDGSGHGRRVSPIHQVQSSFGTSSGSGTNRRAAGRAEIKL